MSSPLQMDKPDGFQQQIKIEAIPASSDAVSMFTTLGGPNPTTTTMDFPVTTFPTPNFPPILPLAADLTSLTMPIAPSIPAVSNPVFDLQQQYQLTKQAEAKLTASRNIANNPLYATDPLLLQEMTQRLMQTELNSLMEKQNLMKQQHDLLGAQLNANIRASQMQLSHFDHHRAWTTDPSLMRLSTASPVSVHSGKYGRLGPIADDPLNAGPQLHQRSKSTLTHDRLGTPPADSKSNSGSSIPIRSPSASDSEMTNSRVGSIRRKRFATTGSSLSTTERRRGRPPKPETMSLEDLAARDMEKKARNRNAAQKSRQKKQMYYQELEKQMATLREENGKLRDLMAQLLGQSGFSEAQLGSLMGTLTAPSSNPHSEFTNDALLQDPQ